MAVRIFHARNVGEEQQTLRVQNSGELRRGIIGIDVEESTCLADGDRGEDWQESP